MGFYLGLILYALLWFAALELNKNRILGWVIALALFGAYALLLRRDFLGAR